MALPGIMAYSRIIRHCMKYQTSIRNIATSTKLFDSFEIQDLQDFHNRVKNSKVPVIVDFFADWCAPCRTLAPRLESVIAENKGKIKLAKVNIDENTDLAMDYEIGAIPVLVVIKNGKVEQRLEGLQDVDKLRRWIDQVLEKEVTK